MKVANFADLQPTFTAGNKATAAELGLLRGGRHENRHRIDEKTARMREVLPLWQWQCVAANASEFNRQVGRQAMKKEKRDAC